MLLLFSDKHCVLFIRVTFIHRAKDVALGGQGAPLVPSGERFLYSQMALCVNLGGIANVGMRGGGAWDICPCNIVMNKLARLYDSSLEYDR